MEYHVPVFLAECLEGLKIDSNGVYVDLTFGGGGHSRAILEEVESGKLYGFDQDEDAWENALDDSRFELVQANFAKLERELRLRGEGKVDGILADLGVSSYQLDVPERGFSYRFDADLDMRMDQTNPLTAAKILNTYSQKDLVRIFSEHGEVRNSKTLAAKVVAEREQSKFETITQLLNLLDRTGVGKKNRYYAQVFQALRIEVNDEFGTLVEMLEGAVKVLKPGGRLVVITYHSLEDRIVKRFLKSGNERGELKKDFYGNVETPFKLINRKAIEPSEEEIARNSRAKSAKLRIVERI